MVKGGNFTSLNADWGAEIIGGSLEVGELLKSRGWWAPTQPTPPGWQTLFATGFELILKILESYSTKKWVLFVDFQNKSMVNRIKQLPDVPYYHETLIKLTFGNDA